ncbi:MAG: hypothetical protein CMO55_28425 [Verrucomicrobiales bacterium]|nr:hypothetical protein [Verrucomicrobiales bacterium]
MKGYTKQLITRSVALFLTSVSLLGFVSCEQPELASSSGTAQEEPIPQEEATSPPPEPDYPIRETIENESGDSLEGEILGKQEQKIVFRRDSDGRIFEIPIPNLSEKVIPKLVGLPEGGKTYQRALSEVPKKREFPRGQFSFQKPPWNTLAEATAEAQKSGLPILLIVIESVDGIAGKPFHPYTESFRRAVLNDRGFKSFVGEHTEFVLIDMGEVDKLETDVRFNLGLGSDFGVTTAILTPKGEWLAMWEGYDRKGPTPYINEIKRKIGIDTPF